ncbi:hypothetical protein [Jeotgalibacillus soli]|nr:hypothetical protein [Jeotgalibacillus soli]
MILGILLTWMASLFVILIGLALLCFGFFFSHAAVMNWVSMKADEAKGSASSLYLFIYYLGGSVCTYLLGYVWEWRVWSAIIITNLILCVIGPMIAVNMKRLDQNTSSASYSVRNPNLQNR